MQPRRLERIFRLDCDLARSPAYPFHRGNEANTKPPFDTLEPARLMARSEPSVAHAGENMKNRTMVGAGVVAALACGLAFACGDTDEPAPEDAGTTPDAATDSAAVDGSTVDGGEMVKSCGSGADQAATSSG